MSKEGGISASTSRIARNTVLLYFRMLLLMLIGLFTSRVVLKTLGVDDYGTYNVVGGLVTMFTIVTTSISQAISRYITVELGKGNKETLSKVFSTSVLIQIALCIVVVLLVETVGLWFLNGRMNIPDGRLGAAHWVLQCSAGILMASLMSVPFNATIIAHEKMDAFAFISILEAVLKLSVALALFFSPVDKLKLYAVLMLVVSIIVRGTYASYCHRHFEETRTKLSFDKSLVKEMSKFAGWNFFGSSAFLLNTQGMNILNNLFFGVGVNAARGVATQVENIVKQFASNFMTAVNPQITKSYATGNTSYTFELVCKASKFTFIILLLFAVPFTFEAEKILSIWLVNVPDYSADFVRLTIFGVMADMTGNSLLTMTLATGNIKRYYILTSIIAFLGLPLAWLMLHLGYSPISSYVVFIVIYLCVLCVKLYVASTRIDFPVGMFLKDVLVKIAIVTVPAFILAWIPYHFMAQTFLRLCVVTAVSTATIGAMSYLFALTEGEKEFVRKTILRK